YNPLIKLKYGETQSLSRYGNFHIARLPVMQVSESIKGLGLIPAFYRNRPNSLEYRTCSESLTLLLKPFTLGKTHILCFQHIFTFNFFGVN
ncbi:hypothetical protein, partial [Xenorhabdus bovienii]|uniref:hypothetical protein n=1 Tax=Xenorhabdus bovienii TaxID=40576 RepID=UPI003DA2E11E